METIVVVRYLEKVSPGEVTATLTGHVSEH